MSRMFPLLVICLAASALPLRSDSESRQPCAGKSGQSRVSSISRSDTAMQIQYLEIVTHDVDAVCAAYSAMFGAQFGKPDAGLGNARTAALPGGALVGVRAPLRESEEPVVRPYWLVGDIEAALAKAAESGAVIAHPALKIPGQGTFAIYIQGGIQHGLWQR